MHVKTFHACTELNPIRKLTQRKEIFVIFFRGYKNRTEKSLKNQSVFIILAKRS